MKVAICVDGSNFYFSVRKALGHKIDIEKFCKKLSGENELTKVGYYIAPVNRGYKEGYAKQQKFFEKIKSVDNLKIILGRLEKHKRDGKTFYVEKATDINLALDLVLDALDSKYDRAFLVSNDGDFSGAVSAVIERFNKEVIYVAIGNKKTISYHLKKVASSTLKINEKFIEDIGLWED